MADKAQKALVLLREYRTTIRAIERTQRAQEFDRAAALTVHRAKLEREIDTLLNMRPLT